ncbi:hypothetical protein SAMN04489867_2560 [Pedococcus dokdonensis]|uniref:Uncharacterized protein n=1 Tax=Pedococcus dokdonensis TaxID=443156 RepID=A0A1H0SYA8_9MICO|nr:hypothetical protein [Pedococcus dokdonensis]SDP46862.1 hypothetical protein SAMN04489867_2560 [Pedococcus dokdonensis]
MNVTHHAATFIAPGDEDEYDTAWDAWTGELFAVGLEPTSNLPVSEDGARRSFLLGEVDGDRTWSGPGLDGAGFDAPRGATVEVEIYIAPADAEAYGMLRYTKDSGGEIAAMLADANPGEYAEAWTADLEYTMSRAAMWARGRGFRIVEQDLDDADADTPWAVRVLVPRTTT